MASDELTPLLYLAPWVDIGGSDKATVDWFRFLDRDRFRASLVTTQPSPNRRLCEVAPYAEELWELPELIAGDEFPQFILSFIHTRAIRLMHIMNSNLAFELLPDIAALPRPPKVVVQLLGEERDGSGYVPYVTSRLGNLVDAFSLCTHSLAGRLEEFDVPKSKLTVVPTAVDAEQDFNPDRIKPIGGLDPDTFHILFLARLVDQKDPLLMVDVAQELRERGLRFQLHVIGDGDLGDAVRRKIAAAGLGDEVVMHGEVLDFAPWYAACDAVLLTSRWEGLPSVAYEAMAMRLALVAPALPGMEELVTPETGVLIGPRDDAAAYAQALCSLAADPGLRQRLGDRGRSIVRSGFSLQRMASEHAALYDDLLAMSPELDDPLEPAPAAAPTPVFPDRRAGSPPLVSVIVPCFNHGRYLPECLESVAEQTYSPIETLIVDDGSSDAETVAVLAEIERQGTATVLRLPENRGPSAARNAGIERADGRYILPLDADDLLVPTAVAELVGQLGRADQSVGFVYPNLQFFGNRRDYLEMPSYNLHALLISNYCAVTSLIDREVFDRGFRFPEELVLGHEDWDFVLTLAEHGIYGEPAETKTLLCRRHGFSRNDVIEANTPFEEVVAARHPELFSRSTGIKAEWNPALTVIALDPATRGSDSAPEHAMAPRQTCADFELLVPASAEPRPGSRGEALASGVRSARGRYLLAGYGSPAQLLADPTLIEKLLRILRADPGLAAVALADAESELPPLRLLDADRPGHAALGALCWTATGASAPPASLSLPGHRPLEGLARWLGVHAKVQWRRLPGDAEGTQARVQSLSVRIGAPQLRRERDIHLRGVPAALPESPPGVPHRLAQMPHWKPAQTRLLCRHRHDSSGHYTYTNTIGSPEGYALEHVLGCVREYPLTGTTSLSLGQTPDLFALGASVDPFDPTVLGFVEQSPLPLFDPLLSGRDPDTGQPVLIAGAEDPLAPGVQEATVLGYVVPYPIRPLHPRHLDVPYGLAGLLRSVDLDARRHRYGVDQAPPGVVAGELGALFAGPTGDCEPLWIDQHGRVFTASSPVRNGRPSLRSAARWTADPLTWSGFGPLGPKLRAAARRALASAQILVAAPEPPGRPATTVGYLLRSDTSQTIPLHAAVHPVTGDQLLSTDPSEAERLGYREVALLGHLLARAPVTGKLGPMRPQAPWAAQFGLVALEPFSPADRTQLRMRRSLLSGLAPLELAAGFSIRPATESDLAAWAELMNGPMGYWDEGRARRELWGDQDVLEGGVQLLLDPRKQLVGSATAKRSGTDPSAGYLHMVFVAPELRGRGLGRAISLAALHRLINAGVDTAILETDDWRLAAIRTYLKLGFEPDLAADGHDARWRRARRLLR
jgi:glycosyltransferase involved in cell wall biosynthesis/ribosomal protein S18 acetylase RimI-like enzyme